MRGVGWVGGWAGARRDALGYEGVSLPFNTPADRY